MQRKREPSVFVASKAGSKMDMMVSPDGVWQDEKEVEKCSNRKCGVRFSMTVHKHHCRYCGLVFCSQCSPEVPLVNGSPLQRVKRTRARRCNACRLPIVLRAYRHTIDGPLRAEPVEAILAFLDRRSINAVLQSCYAMMSSFHVRRVPYFEHISNRFPTAFSGAQVGKGASGTVLLVEDQHRSGLKVALKLVPKHTVASFAMWERLFAEMVIMEGNHHVNVCQMLEVLQTREELVIVMECGEGGTLKAAYDVLRRRHHNMEIFAAHVATQVAAGLQYLYDERSIVHRDLKIENIVLSRDFSRVMIIDFGLAGIIVDKHRPQRFTACGTPGYASPENITPVVVKRTTFFEAIGDTMHAADIFSLGVILFMLLSNSKPMTGKRFGDMYKEMQQGLRCSGSRWAGISDGAKRLVEGCLATKASERHRPRDIIDDAWVHACAPQFRSVADDILVEWEQQERLIADEYDMVEHPVDEGFDLIGAVDFEETFGAATGGPTTDS